MATLRVVDPVAGSGWQQLVERCGGTPLHLPQVHMGDREERDLRLLAFERDGSPVACAPAFVSAPRLHRLRGGAKALELPTAPAIASADVAERTEIHQDLIAACRELGCWRLAVGHTWGECFEGRPPFGAHITERIVEFVLDVSGPLEELLAGMHKAHRKNVRRAERLGLTVRAESTLRALELLREVHQVAARRSEERGQGFAVRSAAYYRRIHERVYGAGIGEVLLAFQGEDCVGALAFLHGVGRGITVRSGCTSAGYEAYAMYLLEYRLLERAKELGLRELNLGGVPADAEEEGHPQHGLYEFKRGFGGRPELRTAVSLDLDRGSHDVG